MVFIFLALILLFTTSTSSHDVLESKTKGTADETEIGDELEDGIGAVPPDDGLNTDVRQESGDTKTEPVDPTIDETEIDSEAEDDTKLELHATPLTNDLGADLLDMKEVDVERKMEASENQYHNDLSNNINTFEAKPPIDGADIEANTKDDDVADQETDVADDSAEFDETGDAEYFELLDDAAADEELGPESDSVEYFELNENTVDKSEVDSNVSDETFGHGTLEHLHSSSVKDLGFGFTGSEVKNHDQRGDSLSESLADSAVNLEEKPFSEQPSINEPVSTDHAVPKNDLGLHIVQEERRTSTSIEPEGLKPDIQGLQFVEEKDQPKPEINKFSYETDVSGSQQEFVRNAFLNNNQAMETENNKDLEDKEVKLSSAEYMHSKENVGHSDHLDENKADDKEIENKSREMQHSDIFTEQKTDNLQGSSSASQTPSLDLVEQSKDSSSEFAKSGVSVKSSTHDVDLKILSVTKENNENTVLTDSTKEVQGKWEDDIENEGDNDEFSKTDLEAEKTVQKENEHSSREMIDDDIQTSSENQISDIHDPVEQEMDIRYRSRSITQSLSESSVEAEVESKILEMQKDIHTSPNTDQELVGSSEQSGDEFQMNKDPMNDKLQEDLPQSTMTGYFTLKPYIVIAEHLLSRMDPWLEELVNRMPPILHRLLLNAPFAFSPARALLVFFTSVISLFIISIFSCLQCRHQNSREREKRKMLEHLSAVQRSLLISEKEREEAVAEIISLKDRVKEFDDRSNLSESEAADLASKVQSLMLERDTLEQKVAEQQQQINDLMMTVSTHSQAIVNHTVKEKSMQQKLEETTANASLHETQLYELQTTLQQSQSSAVEMQSQLQSMSEEIAILQTSKDQLLLEAEGWNEKVQEQTEQICQLLEEEKSHEELISLKDNEISVLRDCFQQLKLFENSLDQEEPADSGENGGQEDEDAKHAQIQDQIQKRIKNMIDVAQTNAKLLASEEEKNSLKHALSCEVESRMNLEDQVKQLKAEEERLKASRLEAEQNANATSIKMDVLMNYFKEKETELNRKLGEQQAREKTSADQLVSTDEKTKEYEKMVVLYKDQMEDLKKEIKKIEAAYKKQISLQEKKAHENWLISRQSEREAKESKMEAQMLRLKVVELQSKLDAASAEAKSLQDSNQTASGLGLENGGVVNVPNENRAASRPLFQPPFGETFMDRRPFLPPPPMFVGRPLIPPFAPPPAMVLDRLSSNMRSPHPFDMWPIHSHMRRSPGPLRDRSPPRNRSPSPPHRGMSPSSSSRGRMSPPNLRYSPHLSHGRSPLPRNRSPPFALRDGQSPRVPPPPGNVRPLQPPYDRTGIDRRPGMRPSYPPPQKSDHQMSDQRSSTPDY